MDYKLDLARIKAAIRDFAIDDAALAKIADAFRLEMVRGLLRDRQKTGDEKYKSSLKMLPSFIDLPTGKEKGTVISLDFGGTNVRARLYQLESGQAKILAEAEKPLKKSSGAGENYDFTTADTTAEELFDFIAALVKKVITGKEKSKLLGWTFSYPARQENIAAARLIAWTKEIKVTGVEGKDVAVLLKEAFIRNGLRDIRIAAIVNDTIATLLSASYFYPDATVAAIYGTGFNACYRETYDFLKKEKPKETDFFPPELINIEAGNFSDLYLNEYDRKIDELSEQPGKQRLEKMVAGRYLGEIFSLVLAASLENPEKDKTILNKFSARDLSDFLTAKTDRECMGVMRKKLFPVVSDAAEKAEAVIFSAEEIAFLKSLAAAIVCRSARLVAAVIAAIINHTANRGENLRQTVAIDGSVYAKMPLIKTALANALKELLGDAAKAIDIRLLDGASGIGAAIAALQKYEILE